VSERHRSCTIRSEKEQNDAPGSEEWLKAPDKRAPVAQDDLDATGKAQGKEKSRPDT